MPEEINRLLTDQIADLLLTPSPEANENLLREGIIPGKIRFVGNVMIDTLVRLLPRAERRWPALSARLARNRYVLVTLHRPLNVDETSTLTEIMAALTEISRQIPVLFPVHPRTRQRIAEAGLHPQTVDLQLVEPLGYLDFLALESHAELVLTDSGGVQEETTYLGVPCLTARPNTERPITVSAGTNRLVEGEREALVTAVRAALQSKPKHRTAPPLWDGLAARRIVQTIARAGRNVSPPLGGVCEVVIPGAL
jgi:UDP-N-acetylglucosamine 2-epimerase (non-hydrolysing)